LAAYWAAPYPDIMGRMPGRLAGSAHDQLVPDGIENPYWQIVRQVPLDTITNMYGDARPEPSAYFYRRGDPEMLVERHSLSTTFSWSVCSPGDIAWIRERLRGRGVVEPGAGLGYWAWQLRQAGTDVVAYDPRDPSENNYVSREPWTAVLRDDHDAVKHHGDRSMLLCWPSYGEQWAEWSLASYKGDQVFYAGEGPGGCCADDGFFDLLDAEWDEGESCPRHVSFSGIHCYLTEYRRKR